MGCDEFNQISLSSALTARARLCGRYSQLVPQLRLALKSPKLREYPKGQGGWAPVVIEEKSDGRSVLWRNKDGYRGLVGRPSRPIWKLKRRLGAGRTRWRCCTQGLYFKKTGYPSWAAIGRRVDHRDPLVSSHRLLSPIRLRKTGKTSVFRILPIVKIK